MTAPPYECPTARTRPGIWRIALATYAASSAMPRSGLTMPWTGMPSACSRSITPFHPELSANAPCTRATVTWSLDWTAVMMVPLDVTGYLPGERRYAKGHAVSDRCELPATPRVTAFRPTPYIGG